jgi:rhamnose utilization protein RhaD (predicted bifunctional aldolase and dehydrogenase)
VSWKDGDTLWIKASGTWLADASRKETFLPVDLVDLKSAMAAGDFNASPRVRESSVLRPSIETTLHALMPHTVVVHLHAVEILARLVRKDCDAQIASLAATLCSWLSVGYFTPGADLARAISQSMKQSPNFDVVFLKNHGVVIGGTDPVEVDQRLRRLVSAFQTQPRPDIESMPCPAISTGLREHGYRFSQDPEIHCLAQNGRLFRRLRDDWALYPDHVVFLGPRAVCFDDADDLVAWLDRSHDRPRLVFLRGLGVLEHATVTQAERAQIKCYCDVLLRQADDEQLNTLGEAAVAQLVDWDAEKYRIGVSS